MERPFEVLKPNAILNGENISIREKMRKHAAWRRSGFAITGARSKRRRRLRSPRQSGRRSREESAFPGRHVDRVLKGGKAFQ